MYIFLIFYNLGTPINKGPTISNRDLSLYRLFRVVQNLGGYNKVTNQSKWRIVYNKMGLPPTTTGSNQIKAAYKKYVILLKYQKVLGEILRAVLSASFSNLFLLSQCNYTVHIFICRYLHAFEDFYRKLGSTMGTISRPGRSRHNSGRSLLSFRERESPKSPRTDKKVKEEVRRRKF